MADGHNETIIGLGFAYGVSACVAADGGNVRLTLNDPEFGDLFTFWTARDALALAHALIQAALAAGVGR